MTRFACAALVTGAVLTTSPAGAQVSPAGGQAAPTFKVTAVAQEGHLIRVPVNKAVIVEFTSPVREARCSKGEVAEVAAISPTKLLVTGKSFGTTQLICWTNDTHQQVFDVECTVDGLALAAQGSGSSRRAAEQVAAEAMLRQLEA